MTTGQTWVTTDGDLISVRVSGLPDKAVMFAFCDEVGVSSYLCLTQDEAFHLARELVRHAESSSPERRSDDESER